MLLDGPDFDEDASHAAFLAAVKAWRVGGDSNNNNNNNNNNNSSNNNNNNNNNQQQSISESSSSMQTDPSFLITV
jgi:hypothetical protein